MTIEQLKQDIINKQVSDDFMIFQWSDNSFLAMEYVSEIAKIRNQKINCLRDINSLLTTDNFLFEDLSDCLSVILCDDFKISDSTQLDTLKNCIVVCKKQTNLDKYTIVFPVLLDWQIKDYIRVRCNGLTDNEVEWLYKITNGDIYRIDNELGKISVFKKEQQDKLFCDMDKEGAFSDLTTSTLFDLSNMIVKRDIKNILTMMRGGFLKNINVFSLVGLLLSSFRNVASIQLGNNATCEKLGWKPNKFKAVYYSCNKYSDKQLISIIKFLSEFDYNVKSGNYDIDDESLVSFVINKVLFIV